MAETPRRRTEKAPAEAPDKVSDAPRKDDKAELRAHGVPQGLLDGTDPDATLIA